MRESAELLDPPSSPSKSSQFANGQSSTSDGDQAMDLDDPPTHEGAETMDTSDPSVLGRPINYNDMINRTIAYGRELNSEFSEEPDEKLRAHFKETMKELFGMLAYKDPRQSPAAKWLDMTERVKIAEGLNSAILGRCRLVLV